MKSIDRHRRSAALPVLAVVASLLVVLSGCKVPPAATKSHGGAVADHVSFVDHLRGAGLVVEIGGPIQQPFLGVPGVELKISGGQLQKPVTVQSFEYDDAKAAAADARKLSPEGNPANTHIGWIAPPNFYHSGRIVVLYVGDDPAARELLKDVLGRPFAGG